MQLNFKSFGQGRPIIFLHGLFGMLDNWQTFGKRMAAEDFLVYLVDQRDHGKSPFTNEFSYPILANDLKAFMDQNWLHEAIVLGHSMGGKTAMQFASEYPDMIDKVIIVDIAPKQYKGGHESIFNALRSINLEKVESRKEVSDHLYANLDEAESTIQFLLKNLRRNKEGGYQWKMHVENLYNHYNSILSNTLPDEEIDVETLFVRGGQSNYINDKDWDSIARQFIYAELKTIEDSGHWVHAQKPDELFDVILSFISK